MSFSAIKVANEFLRLARQDSPARALTPLQLMKLVYIAHGWSLALLSKPLLNAGIQAWKYGPVIPGLYHEIKSYGSSPISDELNEGIWAFGGDISGDEKRLIESVYKKYSRLNGIQLSNLTHMDGTPWALTYQPDAFGLEIPNEIISEHYKQLAKERAG